MLWNLCLSNNYPGKKKSYQKHNDSKHILNLFLSHSLLFILHFNTIVISSMVSFIYDDDVRGYSDYKD